MSWRLFLFCGLLLAVAPRARADDPPAATTDQKATAPPPLAGDLNGDGELSNKEKRKLRRAERRARRRAAGSSSGTADAQEDADDNASDAAGSRGSAASANASKAAATLKSMLPKGDAGGVPGAGAGGKGPAGGAGGGGAIGGDMRGGAPAGGGGGQIGGTSGSSGPGSGPGFFPAGTGSGGPANPKTQADFALAAKSPYAPAFASAGLKLGSDGKTVLRLDGSPATEDDYARLQRAISAMPEALSRRPDFFSAISPEHYSDLKRGLKDDKHPDVYKDVGTTAGDRDFVHTASCDKLSGDCNKNVEKSSYKKGDFVAPEDLDAMWSALQKELDGSAAQEDAQGGSGLPNPGAKRSQLAADAALDATIGFSEDHPGGKAESGGTAVAAGGSAPVAAGSGVVAVAATSVKRLWKTVALGLPGPDGKAKSGAGLMIIIVAAAGALSLAGFFFARRNG